MSWTILQDSEPLVARLGQLLLQRNGLAFLATTRADGSPRVHPVCPVISDGELLLCLIERSPKCADLARDPRCVLHALPGQGHEEFWVEAVAEMLPRTGSAARRASGPRIEVPDGDALYRLNLSAAHATIFEPGPDGRPIPDRRHWLAADTSTARAPQQAGV